MGYFSATGSQPPQACLQHCLGHNPDRAISDGCELIRHLAGCTTVSTGTACTDHNPPHTPAICKCGYEISMRRGQKPDEPTLLVLHPPIKDEASHHMLKPAIDTLMQSAQDQWRLNHENEGLAGEVLQCYEQVNLIFDISGEVAVLTEETDATRVLLDKLQHIYDADQVIYIDEHSNTVLQLDRQNRLIRTRASHLLPALFENGKDVEPSPATVEQTNTIPLPPETEASVKRLRSFQRAFVSSNGDERIQQRGHGTSLWGPLRQTKTQYATVGVVRRSEYFEAGDMLLLDSTLTFGSHILGNMRLVDKLKRASFEAVRALVNAIDQKDPYTCGHSERVGFLAKAVGQSMGLPTHQLRELEWGGLLHDIGKIGIPEHVLNKAGSLTDEEFSLIKKHPARGYAVLKPVESLSGVLDVVLHHHESPDGTGYPDGLAGNDIPLLARIVHVVDTFDALTSTRSYRKAFDHERAISIMKEDTGNKLDPEIMERFLKALAELPHDHPQEYQKWFASSEEILP